jgi:glyoxylase-like metal-dependent hydrolase (beta-lactamase superfamily II)
MHRRSAALLIATLLFPVQVATSQTAGTTGAPTALDSYRRAKGLIDAAIEAHGGIEVLRSARHLRVVVEGWDYHPTQGRRVDPPRDSTWRRNDLMVDLDRRQLISEQRRGWPGGFFYATRFVNNGDSLFTVFPRDRRYTVGQGWDPVERQYGNLFAIPLWYLIAANESAAQGARRYLGRMRLGSDGPEVEAVHFAIPNNGNVMIGVDPESHRLRAVMSVGTDVFVGETEVVTEFLDWREQRGVSLPTRIVTRRGGEITSNVRITHVEPGYVVPDSLLRPPAEFALAPNTPPPPAAEALASGVWLVGGGSRALVVAFSDHVVVVDAPSSSSSEVIRQVPALAGGKPIRFVVPTHHHDDHFLGVRYHAAAGTTIVTTPGNREYLQRILTAPTSSLMLSRNQVPPNNAYRAEYLDGAVRVFSDGERRLEIHKIQSPHADDMLIAWLPAEGILFQADLIEAPRDGAALPGANAETTQHLARVIREQGWQVRQFVGAHANLASPAVFEQLVAQQVVPRDR